MPNWSPLRIGLPSWKTISTTFSLCTVPVFSSPRIGEDLPRLRVDHFAGRRIGVAAVDAEGDPAGLVADGDAGDLLRRHHRRVEDVQAAVGAVGQPQLLLVRRQPDAVAGAAVPLDRALVVAGDLDAVQHLAGRDVADLEAEQAVDVDEAQRLRAVDRERPDRAAERPDAADDGVGCRIGDGQDRRLQAGQIDALAVGTVDGVVRARTGDDLRDARRRSARRRRASAAPRVRARRGSCRRATARSGRRRLRRSCSRPSSSVARSIAATRRIVLT